MKLIELIIKELKEDIKNKYLSISQKGRAYYELDNMLKDEEYQIKVRFKRPFLNDQVAIYNSFTWDNTREGFDFWDKIKRAKRKEY